MSEFERAKPILVQTMAARGFSPRTQRTYVDALRHFDRFVPDRPLEEVNPQHLIEYQRHLASRGASFSAFNIETCALRFFYRECLGKTQWDYTRIRFQKKPRRLPEVLSEQEALALVQAAPNSKYRAVLMTAYGCGLRLGELQALRPPHIDAGRMVLRVEQSKGRKDRYVMLPERLLPELRAYWKQYRPQVYLFEGKHPGRPVSQRSVSQALAFARKQAGISKHVTMHSLRHAFGTHLLEAGVNVRVIQALLGHRSLVTTQIYVHLARTYLVETKSPLDRTLVKKEDGPET